MLGKLFRKELESMTIATRLRRSFMYSNGQEYDKRWQNTFNYAYFHEAEENFPKGRPRPEDSKTYESYFASAKAHFNRRFKNWFTVAYSRRHRMHTPFDMFLLPGSALFMFHFWPLSMGFKILTLVPSVSFLLRIKDKTADPEVPETFLRDMIHKNEAITKHFKVETMQTMDFDFDFAKSFPCEKEFPEFQNPLFSELIRILQQRFQHL